MKTYFLYRPISRAVLQFSKPWRYSLGEELLSTLLTIIDLTSQAIHARKPLKEPYILRILGAIQTAQLFIRLAFDEKLITEHQFFTWSDQAQELSRMAGGWLASVRNP